MKKLLLIFICFINLQYAYSQNLKEALENLVKLKVYMDLNDKSNNALNRVIGQWTKYQLLYPNGRRDWVPQHAQVILLFYPDFGDNTTLMRCQAYQMDGTPYPQAPNKVWLSSPNTICMATEYDPYRKGLEFRFGSDDRGIETLMIKATDTFADIWIIYRRDI